MTKLMTATTHPGAVLLRFGMAGHSNSPVDVQEAVSGMVSSSMASWPNVETRSKFPAATVQLYRALLPLSSTAGRWKVQSRILREYNPNRRPSAVTTSPPGEDQISGRRYNTRSRRRRSHCESCLQRRDGACVAAKIRAVGLCSVRRQKSCCCSGGPTNCQEETRLTQERTTLRGDMYRQNFEAVGQQGKREKTERKGK